MREGERERRGEVEAFGVSRVVASPVGSSLGGMGRQNRSKNRHLPKQTTCVLLPAGCLILPGNALSVLQPSCLHSSCLQTGCKVFDFSWDLGSQQ